MTAIPDAFDRQEADATGRFGDKRCAQCEQLRPGGSFVDGTCAVCQAGWYPRPARLPKLPPAFTYRWRVVVPYTVLLRTGWDQGRLRGGLSTTIPQPSTYETMSHAAAQKIADMFGGTVEPIL